MTPNEVGSLSTGELETFQFLYNALTHFSQIFHIYTSWIEEILNCHTSFFV